MGVLGVVVGMLLSKVVGFGVLLGVCSCVREIDGVFEKRELGGD